MEFNGCRTELILFQIPNTFIRVWRMDLQQGDGINWMEFNGCRTELILFQIHSLEDEEWIFSMVTESSEWNLMARWRNHLDGISWLQDGTNFVPNAFNRKWKMNFQKGDGNIQMEFSGCRMEPMLLCIQWLEDGEWIFSKVMGSYRLNIMARMEQMLLWIQWLEDCIDNIRRWSRWDSAATFVLVLYILLLLYTACCQAWGPDHVQVNSRRLEGLLRLKDILQSQVWTWRLTL